MNYDSDLHEEDSLTTSFTKSISICANSNQDDMVTSNLPKTRKSFSIFGDTACGEPLLTQHLMIDFTPIEEVDNDIIMRKCCDFWKYFNSRTDLHKLMVLPDKNVYPVSNNTDVKVKTDPTTFKGERLHFKEHTAVSMLNIVEENGLIDRTFATKLPQSCSMGSSEYIYGSTAADLKESKEKKGRVYERSRRCKTCKNGHSTLQASKSSNELKIMCKELKEWDRRNPKSLEPTGHPPALTHCVLQRKLTS